MTTLFTWSYEKLAMKYSSLETLSGKIKVTLLNKKHMQKILFLQATKHFFYMQQNKNSFEIHNSYHTQIEWKNLVSLSTCGKAIENIERVFCIVLSNDTWEQQE